MVTANKMTDTQAIVAGSAAEPQPLLRHQPPYLSRLGAQRDADADLAYSLGHGVRHHAKIHTGVRIARERSDNRTPLTGQRLEPTIVRGRTAVAVRAPGTQTEASSGAGS